MKKENKAEQLATRAREDKLQIKIKELERQLEEARLHSDSDQGKDGCRCILQ